MYNSYSMELAGRTLTVDINRVGKQANGCAFMHYGETTVLSTATASEKPREGIDFFPLSVEFEEKLYAVGRIPGSFMRREGRPSLPAVLASRLIDRPIRPLFPHDFRNDVSIMATVMTMSAAMTATIITITMATMPTRYLPAGAWRPRIPLLPKSWNPF